MFTGIVEEMGTIRAVEHHGSSALLAVDCADVVEDAFLGDSISVNGCCVTVTALSGGFTADLMGETLDRTALGALRPGDRVNLERALRADGRLGGHLVQGHVDGVAEVLAVRFFWSVHRRVGADACEPGVARDLRAVAGELGEVAGWLLYDVSQQAAARELNQEALLHARLSGDHVMQLLILQNMSRQAVYANRPREALDLARSVLEDGRLSIRVNTLFIVRKARTLAQAKHRADAFDAFAQARALFLDGVADDDPPWVWWVDEAELAWHEAMCHADLDDWKHATDLFQQATEGQSCRTHFVFLAYFLNALVHVGAWRDVETVIRQILPYVGEVGSTRTAHLLHATTMRIAGLQTPVGLPDAADHLRGLLQTVGYQG